MLIVCIVGMPGSGKSVVVKAAKDIGIPVYNMGDVVREETLKRYGKITPEFMRLTSINLRKEHGSTIIAERTIERIKKDGLDKCIIVVDGVRSLDEINVFKKYGDVVIIAIHASPKTRFERLLKRKRPGDPDNWEEFYKRDKVELEFGIGSVIALADHMIVNEGPIEEAYKRAREILERMIENVCKGRNRGKTN